MKKIIRITFVCMAVYVLNSCNTYKRLGYLQDMEPGIEYSMPSQPEAVITKGDRLNIYVTCSSPELAAPFNVLNGVYEQGEVPGSGVRVSKEDASDMGGFEVDDNGNIEYPILGTLHVEGLTLKELKEQISNRIMEGKFIKEPIVRASFANFRIIVLGEDNKENVYDVPDGKMNIFEALAKSGDLTEDAVRDEVWVIRTREGNRQLYTINLKTKDCYYSPAFYLQQNDMIYVKPMNQKFDSKVNNNWTVTSSIISSVAVAVNLLLWGMRINK
ncbi:MAG: polysaccharide biosynthesis/export family protein [Bacteroidales bacterium]|nr:polysaccharide biosynthesis/export family protein [Bacteroidales bacterium]